MARRPNLEENTARGDLRMQDIKPWCDEIAREHHLLVEWGLRPASINPGEAWTVICSAFEPSMEPHRAPVCEVRLRWPSASHKTVLGAMLWCVIRLGQELDAAKALDTLYFTPPAS